MKTIVQHRNKIYKNLEIEEFDVEEYEWKLPCIINLESLNESQIKDEYE